MELKGTKTEANLKAAFAGESMARNKYTYYASVAKKEGYEKVANVFLQKAEQEKEHAKLEYKLLDGIGDTVANLKDAIHGENYEWTEMYSSFAETAKEEGFDQIAFLFEGLAKIEKDHEKAYQNLLDDINNGKMFKADGLVVWKCRNCGHLHVATEALEVCPVCKHPKAFFEISEEGI